MSVFDRRMAAHIDWLLMLITIVICAAGLLVLYSAGYDPETGVDLFGFASVDFASAACLKQAVYVVAGLVVMAIAMSIPTQFFFRSASLLYVGSLLLLVAVAAFGVVVNGSRRWLDVGVFNLQPAEFMKFALIVAMARRLARKPPEDGKAYRLRGDGPGWVALLALDPGGERLVGRLRLADRLRPDAARAVAGLRALGLEVQLLTGDHAQVAEAIAAKKIPGGVLWFEHDGQAYQRAYGLRALAPAHEPISADTIYDAASLTKVIATNSAQSSELLKFS
jgi:magnesium-transporting ATPase (P-type)